MKKIKTICLCTISMVTLLTSCKKQTKNETHPPKLQQINQTFAAPPYSMPIGIDSANQMIGSYLDGINYTVNTNQIRSFSYDAEVLRTYLNATPGTEVKELKFMLAHNADYAFSANEGKRPDSNSNVLTLIIVGVDDQGDYLFINNNQVMDFCSPCPVACFGNGTAASDFLELKED